MINHVSNTIKLIKEEKIPISSLRMKDELNLDFWDKENNYKLKSSIQEKLLKTAIYFFDVLDLEEYSFDELIIDDIVFTGSLANYNWSKYSDVDLHIIIDLSSVDKDKLDLLKEYAQLKRKIFNDTHDIKILNYEVEVYPQDKTEEHVANGLYSIKRNEWIKFPEKQKIVFDWLSIEQKVREYTKEIDVLEKAIEFGSLKNLETISVNLGRLWEKIKKMRKIGLYEEGEFSPENLIFKVLRRTGYISKILDSKTKLIDMQLSINNLNK